MWHCETGPSGKDLPVLIASETTLYEKMPLQWPI
jgi:hypothetical protein